MKYLHFIFILVSCGVEVGNPPQPNPVPTVSTTLEESDLALITAENLNDIINGATTLQEVQSESINLSLQSPIIKISCEPAIDSTLVSRNSSYTSSVERGLLEKTKRTINSKFEQQSLISYKSDSGPILCSGDNRVTIPWKTITQLAISHSFSSAKARTITLNSSQELLDEQKFAVQGSFETAIKLDELVGENLSITEQHNYQIEKYFSRKNNDKTLEYSVKSETSAESPVIINKVRTSGKVTKFLIKSGEVSHTFYEKQNLVLQYENLLLDSETCLPISGAINISYKSDSQATPILLSASVIAGDLMFIGKDSNQIILNIDPCQIK